MNIMANSVQIDDYRHPVKDRQVTYHCFCWVIIPAMIEQ